MIEPNPKKRLVGIKEAAEYVSVSPWTIYAWISEKRCPFRYVKLGKQLRFDLQDVDRWIDSHKTKSRTVFEKEPLEPALN